MIGVLVIVGYLLGALLFAAFVISGDWEGRVHYDDPDDTFGNLVACAIWPLATLLMVVIWVVGGFMSLADWIARRAGVSGGET